MDPTGIQVGDNFEAFPGEGHSAGTAEHRVRVRFAVLSSLLPRSHRRAPGEGASPLGPRGSSTATPETQASPRSPLSPNREASLGHRPVPLFPRTRIRVLVGWAQTLSHRPGAAGGLVGRRRTHAIGYS